MTTEIELMEEEIKENIEWLETTDGDEVQCISIENLESILGSFFKKRINLRIK